jgi:hypothetical protein
MKSAKPKLQIHDPTAASMVIVFLYFALFALLLSFYVWQQKMVIIISNNFNYHLCVETKNKKPQHIAETVFQSLFLQI